MATASAKEHPRRRTWLVGALVAGALGLACSRSDRAAPPPAQPADAGLAAPERDAASPLATLPSRDERFSEAGLLAEAPRYVGDPAFRRAALEASLVNPANAYSRHRLEHYGRGSRGWDKLPEWNPRSAPVTAALAADLRAGKPLALPEGTAPLWDGTTPTTLAGWVELGRAVFFGYPLRAETSFAWTLAHPDVAARAGVRTGADGVVPGMRVYVDPQGRPALGLACAMCHADVAPSGRVVVGAARRSFDYGALRLAHHADTKAPLDPELARRMRTWGPGRADVTEDDDEDPVAIPDLWGLKEQTHLTQAGTLAHEGPVALALRQETQILHSNHQQVRPPRVLAYALALFLYSLEPPARSGAAAPGSAGPSAQVAAGAALFERRCATCHDNAVRGGAPVPVAKVGTNPALATGTARGTGTYRPPALVRVADAAPYFHDGSVPTLDDVLDPARLAASYRKSPLGPGAAPGHVFGTDLPATDRRALVAFLRTL